MEFLALAASLDLTPANAPTLVGCSGASVADLPVSLLTTFSTKSDLVKFKPVITPMVFSLNHRNFRCLEGWRARSSCFTNLSAGPAHQSQRFLFFLLAKPPPCLRCRTRAAPPPPLLRRPSAAARAPLLLHYAAASRATPAPRTRRACARATTASPCAARTARRRLPRPAPPLRSTFPPSHAHSSALLPYSRRSKGSDSFPSPFDQAPSRCSTNCLKDNFRHSLTQLRL